MSPAATRSRANGQQTSAAPARGPMRRSEKANATASTAPQMGLEDEHEGSSVASGTDDEGSDGSEDEDEDEDISDDSEESEGSNRESDQESQASKPVAASSPAVATAPSSSSSRAPRLDASLFQSYFSQDQPSTSQSKKSILKQRDASLPTAAELEEAELERRRERKRARLAAKRREERKGGIVRGRDGQSMRRLKDGRTIVRSLDTGAVQPQVAGSTASDQLPEVRLPHQSTSHLDDTDRLASKRSARFKKRSLGFGGSDQDAGGIDSAANSQEKKQKKAAADDPLNLEDPAFLPGGQFYHLVGLTGKGKKRGGGRRSKQGVKSKSELRGDALRTSALPHSANRPNLAFARSS
ncbi:unnamed protein product [Jaminaea pallidilutea]